MSNFEILKQEIIECIIRAKSDETRQVLNYLQEFAENNLNNGWISVHDELPQPFKNVLVLNNAGKVGIGFVGNSDWWSYNPTGGFNDYQAKSDFFESDLMNVKYWQQLPQSPKA